MDAGTIIPISPMQHVFSRNKTICLKLNSGGRNIIFPLVNMVVHNHIQHSQLGMVNMKPYNIPSLCITPKTLHELKNMFFYLDNKTGFFIDEIESQILEIFEISHIKVVYLILGTTTYYKFDELLLCFTENGKGHVMKLIENMSYLTQQQYCERESLVSENKYLRNKFEKLVYLWKLQEKKWIEEMDKMKEEANALRIQNEELEKERKTREHVIELDRQHSLDIFDTDSKRKTSRRKR